MSASLPGCQVLRAWFTRKSSSKATSSTQWRQCSIRQCGRTTAAKVASKAGRINSSGAISRARHRGSLLSRGSIRFCRRFGQFGGFDKLGCCPSLHVCYSICLVRCAPGQGRARLGIMVADPAPFSLAGRRVICRKARRSSRYFCQHPQFGRCLKTLKDLTPCKCMSQCWTNEPNGLPLIRTINPGRLKPAQTRI